MRCRRCPFYKEDKNVNECSLTESMYFITLDDCKLVNEDGTINEEECKNEGIR